MTGAVCTSAKQTTEFINLENRFNEYLSKMEDLTFCIKERVNQISGSVTEKVIEKNKEAPCRNGAVGRIKDNLDRMNLLLDVMGGTRTELNDLI